MVTLRQLRYLCALAEHRHFGRAAEACAVSQPALSMQIRNLEKLLGVDLVELSGGSYESPAMSGRPADGRTAAREAYFRYGRGYHPARLNLADCFAYALAKTRDEPLLFKGDDFAKTDIVPAWRP